MPGKIPKSSGFVPPSARRLAKSLDAIIDIINAGHSVESDTIGVEQLPDGRIRPFLKTTPGPYAVDLPIEPEPEPGGSPSDCPPAGAPTHVSISASMEFTYQNCAMESPATATGALTAEIDLTGWASVPSGFLPTPGDTCYVAVGALGTVAFSYECPGEPSDDCPHPILTVYDDRLLALDFYLLYQAGIWYVWNFDWSVDGSGEEDGFCGIALGDAFLTAGTVPLTDPIIGSHEIDASGDSPPNTATATLVFS